MCYQRLGKCILLIVVSLLTLIGCYAPPYNHFKPYHRAMVTTGPGAVVGTIGVAAASGPILVGTGVGAAVGAGYGWYKDSYASIIKELPRYNIEFTEYGDTVTLIVPTDRYFMFNSAQLNQICYPGLATLMKVVRHFPPCPIYIAGFTNSVGSEHHKKTLTQARAEAMAAFFWGNGIPSNRLYPEGYGDKYPVSDNRLIHGSAHNRRLEIQLFHHCPLRAPTYVGYIK
ncbi:MAG: OmpA family protein [Legionella sp.]|nr:OmpA family protein [Legionella sp.]